MLSQSSYVWGVSSVSYGLFCVSGHKVSEALRSSTVAPPSGQSQYCSSTSASWPQVWNSGVHMTVTKRWEGKRRVDYLHACLSRLPETFVIVMLCLFSCLSVGKLTIRRQCGDAKEVWHGGQKSPDNRPWWAPPCACVSFVFVCYCGDQISSQGEQNLFKCETALKTAVCFSFWCCKCCRNYMLHL